MKINHFQLASGSFFVLIACTSLLFRFNNVDLLSVHENRMHKLLSVAEDLGAAKVEAKNLNKVVQKFEANDLFSVSKSALNEQIEKLRNVESQAASLRHELDDAANMEQTFGQDPKAAPLAKDVKAAVLKSPLPVKPIPGPQPMASPPAAAAVLSPSVASTRLLHPRAAIHHVPSVARKFTMPSPSAVHPPIKHKPSFPLPFRRLAMGLGLSARATQLEEMRARQSAAAAAGLLGLHHSEPTDIAGFHASGVFGTGLAAHSRRTAGSFGPRRRLFSTEFTASQPIPSAALSTPHRRAAALPASRQLVSALLLRDEVRRRRAAPPPPRPGRHAHTRAAFARRAAAATTTLDATVPAVLPAAAASLQSSVGWKLTDPLAVTSTAEGGILTRRPAELPSPSATEDERAEASADGEDPAEAVAAAGRASARTLGRERVIDDARQLRDVLRAIREEKALLAQRELRKQQKRQQKRQQDKQHEMQEREHKKEAAKPKAAAPTAASSRAAGIAAVMAVAAKHAHSRAALPPSPAGAGANLPKSDVSRTQSPTSGAALTPASPHASATAEPVTAATAAAAAATTREGGVSEAALERRARAAERREERDAAALRRAESREARAVLRFAVRRPHVRYLPPTARAAHAIATPVVTAAAAREGEHLARRHTARRSALAAEAAAAQHRFPARRRASPQLATAAFRARALSNAAQRRAATADADTDAAAGEYDTTLDELAPFSRQPSAPAPTALTALAAPAASYSTPPYPAAEAAPAAGDQDAMEQAAAVALLRESAESVRLASTALTPQTALAAAAADAADPAVADPAAAVVAAAAAAVAPSPVVYAAPAVRFADRHEEYLAAGADPDAAIAAATDAGEDGPADTAAAAAQPLAALATGVTASAPAAPHVKLSPAEILEASIKREMHQVRLDVAGAEREDLQI